MASTDEIQAVREMQRAAAASGTTLSYRQALESVRNPPIDAQAQTIQRLGLEIASLRGELAKVKSELASVRVVGVGHSGEGPRGMMFSPEALDADSGTGSVNTTQIIAVSYDPGTNTVSAERMSGPLTSLGPYVGS
jgi:hypothetical protein